MRRSHCARLARRRDAGRVRPAQRSSRDSVGDPAGAGAGRPRSQRAPGRRAPDRIVSGAAAVLATFVYFILPVILLCIGFPIYLILLLSSLIAVLFVADVSTTVIQTNMFGSLDNFPLLAIPFFILAGEIMGQGGIARRVIVWVTALTGSARGSLPVTTIVSSELFGAMSHTAVGTVAAVGRLVYPAPKSGGHGGPFTVRPNASPVAIAGVSSTSN